MPKTFSTIISFIAIVFLIANAFLSNETGISQQQKETQNIESSTTTIRVEEVLEEATSTTTTTTIVPEKITEPTDFEESLPNQVFYKNIKLAILDLNDQSFQNAKLSEKDAAVMVDRTQNSITVLKNTSIDEIVRIKKKYDIALNGKTITLTKNGMFFIEEQASLTILGSGDEKLYKKATTQNAKSIFHCEGKLQVNNTMLELDTKSISGSQIIFCAKNATLYTEKSKFLIKAKDYINTALYAESTKNITVKECQFNAQSTSGRITAIHYQTDKGSQNTLLLSNSKITTKTNSAEATGIYIAGIESVKIENVDILVEAENCGFALDKGVAGIDIARCANVTIDNTDSVAIQTSPESNYKGFAIHEGSNENIVINDGTYCGWTSDFYSNVIINNATFSGIHSGLELFGTGTSVINNGYFESPWHGGIYVSCGNAYINNATLGAPKLSESIIKEKTNIRIFDDSQTEWNGTLYSCIYFGSPTKEVKATLNECKFKYEENLPKGYVISLTTNHSHKNIFVHLNNISTKYKLRNDGENKGGFTGHLFLSEVTHGGIVGNGKVFPMQEPSLKDTEQNANEVDQDTSIS